MRYKEFNSNKVLEDCITLFWKNGYGSCSIKDIVEQTRVNRYSLYNEFENKDGILLAALSLYRERYSDKRFQLLQAEGPLNNTLLDFYSAFLNETEAHVPGCFVIYIASEKADSDPIIKARLDHYLSDLEEHFRQLLSKHGIEGTRQDSVVKRLTGLFCNSTCYCVIQSPEERISYIKNSLNLILNE